MKNGNEAAFPASASWRDEQPEVIQVQQEGLSKREWLAGLAMQGLLANPRTHEEITFDNVVKSSIMYADELLSQLEKPTEPLNDNSQD